MPVLKVEMVRNGWVVQVWSVNRQGDLPTETYVARTLPELMRVFKLVGVETRMRS